MGKAVHLSRLSPPPPDRPGRAASHLPAALQPRPPPPGPAHARHPTFCALSIMPCLLRLLSFFQRLSPSLPSSSRAPPSLQKPRR